MKRINKLISVVLVLSIFIGFIKGGMISAEDNNTSEIPVIDLATDSEVVELPIEDENTYSELDDNLTDNESDNPDAMEQSDASSPAEEGIEASEGSIDEVPSPSGEEEGLADDFVVIDDKYFNAEGSEVVPFNSSSRSGDNTKGASALLYSDNTEEDYIDLRAGNPLMLYAGVNISGIETMLSTPVLKVTIPKKYLNEGEFSFSDVENTQVYQETDATNVYVYYKYNPLSGANSISAPIILKMNPRLTPPDSTTVVKAELFNNDISVDTKEFTIRNKNEYSRYTTDYNYRLIETSFQDVDRIEEFLTDYHGSTTITTSVLNSYSYLPDEVKTKWIITLAEDIKVEEFPVGMEYDESTRTLTGIYKGLKTKLDLDFIIPKVKNHSNNKVGSSKIIIYNKDLTDVISEQAFFSAIERDFEVEHVIYSPEVMKHVFRTSHYLSITPYGISYTDDEKDTEFKFRSSASNDSYYKNWTEDSGLPRPEKTEVRANKISLPLKYYEERPGWAPEFIGNGHLYFTSFTLSEESTVEPDQLEKNVLYGITIDGTKIKIAENVPVGGTVAIDANLDNPDMVYRELSLEFPEPIIMPDRTKIVSEFKTKIIPSDWENARINYDKPNSQKDWMFPNDTMVFFGDIPRSGYLAYFNYDYKPESEDWWGPSGKRTDFTNYSIDHGGKTELSISVNKKELFINDYTKISIYANMRGTASTYNNQLSYLDDPQLVFLVPNSWSIDDIGGISYLSSLGVQQELKGKLVYNWKDTQQRAIVWRLRDIPLADLRQVSYLNPTVTLKADSSTIAGDSEVKAYLLYKNTEGIYGFQANRDEYASAENSAVIVDDKDYNENGLTTDKIGMGKETITFNPPRQVIATMGSGKTQNSITPITSAPVNADERFYYGIEIKNFQLTESIKRLTSIGIIPKKGDFSILPNTEGTYIPRGTEFDVEL
ncbi:MAG: hypothetical protein Q4P65_04100, partial [Eubacteriales bacterium]|nr:hypothetical protein [Eubacteriales bacterium]